MPTVVNTELTSGVGQKWVKPVEAEDVANEIVDAMEVPRFDVFVPRANGALYKILALLPRSWREAIGRAMKVDKLMIEVDHGARRAYEEAGRGQRAGPGRGRRARRRRPSATPPEPRALNFGPAEHVNSPSGNDGTDLRRHLGPGLLGPLRPLLQGGRRGGTAGDAPRRCWPGRGGGCSSSERAPASTWSSTRAGVEGLTLVEPDPHMVKQLRERVAELRSAGARWSRRRRRRPAVRGRQLRHRRR